MNLSRREFLAGLAGTMISACVKEQKKEEQTVDGESMYEPVTRNEYFDGKPEFLQTLTQKDGEWSKEQRKKRKVRLKNGEQILHDVGLSFYLVQKNDSISEIRQKLSKYDEFKHLDDQTGKLESFNIPAKKLRQNLWIPIPIENKDRELSEAQFVAYTCRAIEEMIKHPIYGHAVQAILETITLKEFVASIVAVAKQEGGGKPLGQFELHRWEHRYQAFSFSYFHILMSGPGLKARKKLNLTEGQLYHPINAVKLFVAFMIEKSGLKPVDRLFPIPKHKDAFAKFYNGKSWKKINPHYLTNWEKYYTHAMDHLNDKGDRWFKNSPALATSK